MRPRTTSPFSESPRPTTRGLEKYDDLPPAEALKEAWLNPGRHPGWHHKNKAQVRQLMPLVARAIERIVKETK